MPWGFGCLLFEHKPVGDVVAKNNNHRSVDSLEVIKQGGLFSASPLWECCIQSGKLTRLCPEEEG